MDPRGIWRGLRQQGRPPHRKYRMFCTVAKHVPSELTASFKRPGKITGSPYSDLIPNTSEHIVTITRFRHCMRCQSMKTSSRSTFKIGGQLWQHATLATARAALTGATNLAIGAVAPDMAAILTRHACRVLGVVKAPIDNGISAEFVMGAALFQVPHPHIPVGRETAEVLQKRAEVQGGRAQTRRAFSM